MIVVGERKYRTLEDEMTVNGSKVYEVTANGRVVYPEERQGDNEWDERYWLRVSGETYLYYMRGKYAVNGGYTVPSPDKVWIKSKASAVFNAPEPILVGKGHISASQYARWNPKYDGHGHDVIEYGGSDYDNISCYSVYTDSYGYVSRKRYEAIICSESNWPTTHTEMYEDRLTHKLLSSSTNIFDKEFTGEFVVRSKGPVYPSSTSTPIETDVISPSLPADALEVVAQMSEEQDITYHRALGGVSLYCTETSTSVSSDYQSGRTVTKYSIGGAGGSSTSSTNRCVGFCAFTSIDYANYDVDMAMATLKNGEDMSQVPYTIAPMSERYARL